MGRAFHDHAERCCIWCVEKQNLNKSRKEIIRGERLVIIEEGIDLLHSDIHISTLSEKPGFSIQYLD